MAHTFSIEDAGKAGIVTIADGRGGQAVHDLVVAFGANRRSGTACAKTRGEVKASGKKPYRQKGTGNARRGGNASPLHRGGGVVFGPRPRDYSKDVPKKVRRLAFARALTARIEAGDVLLSGPLAVADGKTKSLVASLSKVTDARKVLVIGSFDETTFRAARNVQPVLLMSPEEVNVEHLLYYDKIVITENGLGALAGRTKGVLSERPAEAATE
ncbi:MAG: large subunit ribosomal protein L4 [Verrucomicrobia bacterium]|jgi:large subunit ribosomal protein L4|nr:MAG: large subunit ribosomal protein L4 [Verrucomicrobiota bacterium]